MTSKWTTVDSTNIAAISFDAGDPETDTGKLFVKFSSGSVYTYEPFPSQLAEEFFEAESKGQFFHTKIRGDYQGQKQVEIQEEPTETRFQRQRDDEKQAGGSWADQETDTDDGVTAAGDDEGGGWPDAEQRKELAAGEGAVDLNDLKRKMNLDLPDSYVESVDKLGSGGTMDSDPNQNAPTPLNESEEF